MVKASKPAARRFVASPSITTEMPDKARPKPKASPPLIRPDGTGRPAVRRILASISASHHMFSAPEAPPPKAMNKIAAKPTTGCTPMGATSRPTKAVNTTSDITRGFSNSTKSPN